MTFFPPPLASPLYRTCHGYPTLYDYGWRAWAPRKEAPPLVRRPSLVRAMSPSPRGFAQACFHELYKKEEGEDEDHLGLGLVYLPNIL